MYRIAKRFSFSASHRLLNLSADHPCMRLHGHNYDVEVVLLSDALTPEGFVVDYRALEPFKRLIDEQYDHQHLNDVLGTVPPTAENLARVFYQHARDLFERRDLVVPLLVSAVRVSETAKTWAEYIA